MSKKKYYTIIIEDDLCKVDFCHLCENPAQALNELFKKQKFVNPKYIIIYDEEMQILYDSSTSINN